jgi:DNA-directed RNA polymerase specialized sigma24 family protein
MRKLREVLRLRYELKLGYQQIGRSCAIAVSTVHKSVPAQKRVFGALPQ